jgi:hypothetical protein
VSNPIVAVGRGIDWKRATLLITGGPVEGTRAGASTDGLMDIGGLNIGGVIAYLGDCIASGMPSRFMSTPVTAQFGLPSPVVSNPIVAVGKTV